MRTLASSGRGVEESGLFRCFQGRENAGE